MFLAEALADSLPPGTAPHVTVLGVPRTFIPQDKPDRILAGFGLDGPGVAATVRTLVDATADQPTGEVGR
jgi:deoxyxylulose-5-phosphate synthase